MSAGRTATERVLRAIWRDKMHVEPTALDLSTRSVRERYPHIWAPADALSRLLAPLPVGLLALWRDAEAGHVVFTHTASRYAPGPQPWRDGVLPSVCYLSVGELLDDPRHALETWLRLLDHLLGSGAQTEEGWFSRGAGLTDPLQEAAQRYVQIEALGYGHQELGAHSGAAAGAGDYFARTLSLYLEDSRALSVLDPPMFKLYRSTLMDEGFWSRA
jgi:hypothetical protein